MKQWIIALATGTLLVSGLSVHATPIEAAVSTEGDQAAYDGNISSSDLINFDSPALLDFTASRSGSFDESGTNDGEGGASSNLAYWGSGSTVDLTYTLTGSADGYDITSINTIYGWGDSAERHVAQRYTVFIATVSNPGFTELLSVEYDPFTTNVQAASQVTLTDTGGVLASGVTGIRFTAINDPGGSEIGVIREYDVFGTPTVIPEPMSVGLLGLGLLALFRRRLIRADA